LKVTWQQNSMKFSQADSHVKMWRFSYIFGTNHCTHEDEDGVSYWNTRKPSHIDTAVYL